jgi:hypothetical protein
MQANVDVTPNREEVEATANTILLLSLLYCNYLYWSFLFAGQGGRDAGQGGGGGDAVLRYVTREKLLFIMLPDNSVCHSCAVDVL